jgi:hypothetical protein
MHCDGCAATVRATNCGDGIPIIATLLANAPTVVRHQWPIFIVDDCALAARQLNLHAALYGDSRIHGNLETAETLICGMNQGAA